MHGRSDRYRLTLVVFWVLAFATVPALWVLQPPPPGLNDLHVYGNAIRSLQAGRDPYADGIAVQRVFHGQLAQHPDAIPPYTYVYSPITLPLLRAIGRLPSGIAGALYWAMYAAGLLAAVLVGVRFAEPGETRLFNLLAPAAAFFPGLLQADVLMSGNLAYILYGLVFATALVGWRRGDWRWFYIATVGVSCFKAPMLTLLAIPVLSARSQWLPAGLAAGGGLVLFAAQPLLWPSLFHNYLEAVALQFSYNHDFGLSLAGLLGNVLFYYGLPYSLASTLCYLVYGSLVLATLLYLSRRYFAGDLSLERWMPVALLGVVLLNPRIKEYDIAPLTLPMAMVLWRVCARGNSMRRAAVTASLLFAAANAIAIFAWKPTEGILLVALFIAGSWNLLRESRKSRGSPVSVAGADRIAFRDGAVSV